MYQLDLELAWSTGETVMSRVEKLMKSIFQHMSRDNEWSPSQLEIPFLRMSYEDAMNWHGSDKPDLRIPYSVSIPTQTSILATNT